MNSDQGLTQWLVKQLTSDEKDRLNDIDSFISSFCQSNLSSKSSAHPLLLNSPPWINITPAHAHKICMLALTDNYGAVKSRIPHPKAIEFVDLFLSFFSIDAKYFTKSEYEFENEKTLMPWKSKGTVLSGDIEHGVICIDENNVGILWVNDED